MKKILCALFIFFALFLLVGCQAKNDELQDELIVEAVGIDLGENGEIKLTVQTLNTEDYPTNGEGAASGKISAVHSVSGKTINEALNRLSLSTGKNPVYSHNRIVVIGESVYRRQDVGKYIDFFIRSCQSRDNLLIVASESDAETIAGAQMGEGKLPAKIAEEIVQSGKKNGLCTAVQIYEFMNMYSNPARCEYMPILKAKEEREQGKNDQAESGGEEGGAGAEKSLEAVGTLVTKNGKYAMTLDGQETQMLTFLTERLSNSIIEGNTEETAFSLRIIGSRAKITPRITDDGKPRITVALNCYCAITEMDYKRTGTTTEDVKAITAAAEEKVRQTMHRLFQKTALDQGCDIFNLYAKFQKKETDYFKKIIHDEADRSVSESWSELLKNLGIDYEIEITVHRPGQDVFRG